MSKTLQLAFAAMVAAFIGFAGLAPARAAGIPAGSATLIDQSTKPQADAVQWHGRRHAGGRPAFRGRPAFSHRPAFRPRPVYSHRPVYRHRPAYVRRHVYSPPVYVHRPAPVYRRCVMRPRIVWTPYGYARRMVRVCRPLPRPRPVYFY